MGQKVTVLTVPLTTPLGLVALTTKDGHLVQLQSRGFL